MSKEKLIHVKEARPNVWNPNRMTDEQFSATLHSLRVHGFTSPIITREPEQVDGQQLEHIMQRLGKRAEGLLVSNDDLAAAKYEIIDGEHRWVVVQHLVNMVKDGKIRIVNDAIHTDAGWVHTDGAHLGVNEIAREAYSGIVDEQGGVVVPIYHLGKIPRVEAQRLTVVLNETRGAPDIAALSQIIKQIAEDVGPDALAATLPPDVIGDINLGLDSFDWDSYVDELDKAIAEEETITMPFAMDSEAYGVFAQAAQLIAEQNGWEFQETEAGIKRAVIEMVRAFLAVEK